MESASENTDIHEPKANGHAKAEKRTWQSSGLSQKSQDGTTLIRDEPLEKRVATDTSEIPEQLSKLHIGSNFSAGVDKSDHAGITEEKKSEPSSSKNSKPKDEDFFWLSDDDEDEDDGISVTINSPLDKSGSSELYYEISPKITSSEKQNGIPSSDDNQASETPSVKPWNLPGADITDYYNYGFDENIWKAYCKKQVEFRLNKSKVGLKNCGLRDIEEHNGIKNSESKPREGELKLKNGSESSKNGSESSNNDGNRTAKPIRRVGNNQQRNPITSLDLSMPPPGYPFHTMNPYAGYGYGINNGGFSHSYFVSSYGGPPPIPPMNMGMRRSQEQYSSYGFPRDLIRHFSFTRYQRYKEELARRHLLEVIIEEEENERYMSRERSSRSHRSRREPRRSRSIRRSSCRRSRCRSSNRDRNREHRRRSSTRSSSLSIHSRTREHHRESSGYSTSHRSDYHRRRDSRRSFSHSRSYDKRDRRSRHSSRRTNRERS